MGSSGIYEGIYEYNPKYVKVFKIEATTVMEARKIAEAFLKKNRLGKLVKIVYLWPKDVEDRLQK